LLLDHGKGWRDLVDVQVGVQSREEKVCCQAYGSCGGVEFVEEALVPGVDAVLEDFLHGLEQAIFAATFIRK
jgi:hypothetical protein